MTKSKPQNKRKERIYNIWSTAHIIADGYVRAKNKKEAREKWTEFVENGLRSTSIGGVYITETIPETNKNFDRSSFQEKRISKTTDCYCCSDNYFF